MPYRLRFAAVAAATIAVIGGLWLLQRHDEAPPPDALRAPSSARKTTVSPPGAALFEVARPQVASSARGAKPLPPLPRSLQDTDVDGWLGVDDQGHLVVTPGVRRFFDYFLSATGEESPATIRARIVAEIEKRLPPAGAREAIALLDHYLAYRDRVRELEQSSNGPEDLHKRLDEVHRIREQSFGAADATAMFGEEETVQRLDIERRQVLADDALSPTERQQQLDALEQELPADVKEARDQATGPLRLAREEKELRAAGAGAAEVRALREQEFGAAAADRLQALDQERSQWQQRMADYRAARDTIENDPALSPEARTQAIAALRSRSFNPQEQIRVEALERMEALNQ